MLKPPLKAADTDAKKLSESRSHLPALILSQAHTYEHTYLLTPLALLKVATSRRSTIAQHENSSPNFDRSTNSDSFLTISEAFSREKEAIVVMVTSPVVDRAGPLGEA